MNRREFLKLVGLGTMGTVFFGACDTAQGKKYGLASPITLPEEHATGVASWYASTCQQCSSGCGIIVRVLEGRAKKIEGNPAHPINQGKLCARGQAALQMLYSPDRLGRPLRAMGPRGSRQFAETTWDEGIDQVVRRLSDIQSQRNPDRFLFLTGHLTGAPAIIIDHFAKSFGSSSYVGYELFGNDPYYVANRLAFGQEGLPEYDFENASYVLSFGANFLENWLSPVWFSRTFGVLRQRTSMRRGKIVQIEQRLSLTAGRADEWVPVNPGTEGILALAMANVILTEGLASNTSKFPSAWRDAVLEYTPDRVAERTGVAENQIRRIARDFASSQPAIALGGASVAGQTNGVESLVAINLLNMLVGSVGIQGGVRFSQGQFLETTPPRGQTSYAGLKAAVDKLNLGLVDTVFIYGANPVFNSPPSLGLADALGKAQFVVSFSSFLDETSSLADLILPDNTFLEKWSSNVPEYGAGNIIFGAVQPVVSQVLDTRPTEDVLLAVAKAIGGDLAKALPWNNSLEMQKDYAQQLMKLGRGSIQEGDANRFWNKMLQNGGWWDEASTIPSAADTSTSLTQLRVEEPQFEGDAKDYPFHLHVYESVALGDGRGANLPWLQELPDPLTTVVWGSWVEINPMTADKLGLTDGDAVWVESSVGKILAPVIRFSGAMPSVISIPVGQGHKSYGQYAQNRGVNPLEILAPLTDTQSGSLAFGATRVRISKANQTVSLVKIERVSGRSEGRFPL